MRAPFSQGDPAPLARICFGAGIFAQTPQKAAAFPSVLRAPSAELSTAFSVFPVDIVDKCRRMPSFPVQLAKDRLCKVIHRFVPSFRFSVDKVIYSPADAEFRRTPGTKNAEVHAP